MPVRARAAGVSGRRTSLLGGVLVLSCAAAGCVLASCGSAAEQPHGDDVSSSNNANRWEEDLAAVAEAAGITDPPVVTPVRTVSPEESKAVVDDCLVERGWSIDPDGSFSIHRTQQEQFEFDRYVCIASYPIGEIYLEPYDQRQWEVLYDYWVNEFIPCLASKGFDVVDPPSRETFLAAPEEWHPIGDRGIHDQLSAAEAEGTIRSSNEFLAQVCPVSPGEDLLYPAQTTP